MVSVTPAMNVDLTKTPKGRGTGPGCLFGDCQKGLVCQLFYVHWVQFQSFMKMSSASFNIVV